MNNSDMPAMPCTGDAYDDVTTTGNSQTTNGTGLTKREHFAGMIMSGFAADPEMIVGAPALATIAVKWSEALLAELDKGNG